MRTAYLKRAFSYRCSPLDGVLEFGLWHGHEDGPDEAAEFSGNGGDGNMSVFSLIKPEELLGESVLGFEGDSDDVRRLPLPAPIEDKSRSGTMVVVPCSFDEQSSDVGITGFGNGSSILPGAGGVFGRNQAKVCHQLARRRKAADVVDLAQEREGGKGLHSSQATEGFNMRAVSA